MPINQPMKSMVSGLHIRASNSYSFKTKAINQNRTKGLIYMNPLLYEMISTKGFATTQMCFHETNDQVDRSKNM